MKDFVTKLVVEGSRVFWTAVEAAAGFTGAYVIPDEVLDFLGAYETPARAAIGIALAAIATWLKERARAHLSK